jgi:excisionase family DNA binding protein
MFAALNKNDTLLSVNDVAEITTLSISQVYQEIKRGSLTAFRFGGKRIVIRHRDVVAYMAARMRPMFSSPSSGTDGLNIRKVPSSVLKKKSPKERRFK